MKKVLLLLAKGFESYEASVFIDVMGWNFDSGGRNDKAYYLRTSKRVGRFVGYKGADRLND